VNQNFIYDQDEIYRTTPDELSHATVDKCDIYE